MDFNGQFINVDTICDIITLSTVLYFARESMIII